MHARTWLSVLSLPMVGAFTYPLVQHPATPSAAAAKQTPPDPLAGTTDIEDVLSLVQRDYVDPPDMSKVIAGGVQAALERAHPMNAYLTPEDLRLPPPGPASAGLVVIKRGIYALVLAVTPGGPAAKAGIQPGDVIRKVDGDSVGLLSAWALERRLRGTPGTALDLYRYSNLTGDLLKSSLKLALIPREPVTIQKSPGGVRIVLPDLGPGRAKEVEALLAGVDRKQSLVLDLRQCVSLAGSAEETATLAGFLGVRGRVGTLQEHGRPDRPLEAGPLGAPFAKMAVLVGHSTLGMPEVLAACLKKHGARILGERTPGLAILRKRFLLRQGGAVELVCGRWLGDGGEKLDRTGVVPNQTLKLGEADDPLAKALDALKTPMPTPIPAGDGHQAA